MSLNKQNLVRATVFAALCIAIGITLPIAFHTVPNGGKIFLPMHLPVLLCGLISGPIYGLLCGILTPALSSLLTGMPMAAALPGMLCELAVYGAVSGLLVARIPTEKPALRVESALVGAMLCGRVVSGVLNALIFNAGSYSVQLWLTASFVTALPGILVQLILIPVLVLTLERAGLIRLVRQKESV